MTTFGQRYRCSSTRLPSSVFTLPRRRGRILSRSRHGPGVTSEVPTSPGAPGVTVFRRTRDPAEGVGLRLYTRRTSGRALHGGRSRVSGSESVGSTTSGGCSSAGTEPSVGARPGRGWVRRTRRLRPSAETWPSRSLGTSVPRSPSSPTSSPQPPGPPAPGPPVRTVHVLVSLGPLVLGRDRDENLGGV